MSCHASLALRQAQLTAYTHDHHRPDDVALMRAAIAQAKLRTTEQTEPNPIVGCIIANEAGTIVGRGFHPKAGQPHAEIFALMDAGCTVEKGDSKWRVTGTERVQRGTAYVTLEPCSHVGRTPPCCHALVDSGVSRVVVGMVDPAPWVAGQGIDVLRGAGIEVEVGVEKTACEALNLRFIERMAEEGKRRE